MLSDEMRAERPWLLRKVQLWLQRAELRFLLSRYGGVQQCTWCGQPMEASWKPWQNDISLDELTCACCGGTSIWLWGMGFHYIREGSPPPPKFKRHPEYAAYKPENPDG